MSKRKNIEQDLFSHGNSGIPEDQIKRKIEYPFCLKSKDNKRYWRYLQDGRFEFIEINRFNSTLHFGIYKNTLTEIFNEDEFYFKVMRHIDIEIKQEEFEGIKNELIRNYQDYLNNDKYSIEETKEIPKTEIVPDIYDESKEDYPF